MVRTLKINKNNLVGTLLCRMFGLVGNDSSTKNDKVNHSEFTKHNNNTKNKGVVTFNSNDFVVSRAVNPESTTLSLFSIHNKVNNLGMTALNDYLQDTTASSVIVTYPPRNGEVDLKTLLSQVKNSIKHDNFDLPFDVDEILYDGYFYSDRFEVNVPFICKGYDTTLVCQFEVELHLDNDYHLSELHVTYRELYDENSKIIPIPLSDQHDLESQLERVIESLI